MKGFVHSIQSFGTLDGPGVRYVVFLQGCNLRCGCCHNPDTWEMKIGEQKEAQTVFENMLRYRNYFGKDGGITVSGGEALLQAEFVTELFTLCKQAQIPTCLDTSGSLLNDSVKKLLSVTDLVLLDIKYTNDADYQEFVGCSLSQVLDFLNLLERSSISTWIRQVIIGGKNDSDENLLELSRIIAPYSCIKKTQLLAFRKLCSEKYKKLGFPFPFGEIPETTPEKIEELTEKLTHFLP